MRPLRRYYMQGSAVVLFLHDCSNQENTEDSLQQLNETVEYMIYNKCRYIWILLNKQDLLPSEKCAGIIADLRQKVESRLVRFDNKVIWTIMDQPGLSSWTGAGLYEVLDNVRETLLLVEKLPKPVQELASVKEGLSQQELEEHIKKASATAENDCDFWASFIQGDLPVWDHYNHLRAGYTILIDTLANGYSVFEGADTFLSHLERLRALKPEKFRNIAHK